MLLLATRLSLVLILRGTGGLTCRLRKWRRVHNAASSICSGQPPSSRYHGIFIFRRNTATAFIMLASNTQIHPDPATEPKRRAPHKKSSPTSTPLFLLAHSGLTRETSRRAIGLLKRPQIVGMWDALFQRGWERRSCRGRKQHARSKGYYQVIMIHKASLASIHS